MRIILACVIAIVAVAAGALALWNIGDFLRAVDSIKHDFATQNVQEAVSRTLPALWPLILGLIAVGALCLAVYLIRHQTAERNPRHDSIDQVPLQMFNDTQAKPSTNPTKQPERESLESRKARLREKGIS